MLVIGRQGLWAVATTSGKQKRHSSQQRAMLPCCCCCHVLADDACALWCILAPLNLLLGCLLCSIGWTCLLLFDWVPIALLRYCLCWLCWLCWLCCLCCFCCFCCFCCDLC